MRLTIIFLFLFILIIGYFLYKIFKELVEKKAQTKLLKEKEKLLYLDPLTGLRNRNYFNHIEEKMDSMPYPQGFIISDLNDLKKTNDLYGHLVGDVLIIKYAEVLKEVFKDWIIFRTGGDEFLLFKKSVDKDEMQALIKKSKEVLKETSIKSDDGIIEGVSAAIGYSIRESSDKSIEEMIKIADQAMYKDKKNRSGDKKYDL